MQAFRTEMGVGKNGTLQITALPFHEGEVVEVIVLPRQSQQDSPHSSLKGKIIEYKDPFEPVAQDDWEAIHDHP